MMPANCVRTQKHVIERMLTSWFVCLFLCFQLMSSKKDVKKSPLIETTTTEDNNQSLKPLKRLKLLLNF